MMEDDHIDRPAKPAQRRPSLHGQLPTVAGVVGYDDEKVRKLADPDVRRQMVPIIHQARDKDAEAADHIERALGNEVG